ncbi:HNH endonuclease [Streptomyces celluloflavus]|uniref:HNH endonuclease n=1 Tax=Streptomyces celluloflavus TaxID=58344 RepID=UPI0036C18478
MTGSEFYRVEPSARSSWRLAVLMGANSRTYKFALGRALLDLARQGHAEVPLRDLAVPYAMSLVEHAAQAPQASERTPVGTADFLAVVAAESAESRRLGTPTDRLLDAAVRSLPAMVLRKFHNLRGIPELPHRFYEVTGSGGSAGGSGGPGRRIVRLTDDLHRVARSEQAVGLRAELGARWSIVENSFATGIGRSLIADGFTVDRATSALTDTQRRRSVAGVTEAVIGFQHGRCLTCGDDITPECRTVVDHVFPYALMKRYGSVSGWPGPDLDQLWNLAPAHEACNSVKSDRLPTDDELRRLARRNTAIMESPVPLKRTLQLTLEPPGNGRRPGGWPEFLREVSGLVS